MKFLLKLLGFDVNTTNYKPTQGTIRTDYRDEDVMQFTSADQAIIDDRIAKGVL